ncbi:MAG: peptide-methionine (S)-S-oxide reductase MsrA [Gemmatimonadota bacterium]
MSGQTRTATFGGGCFWCLEAVFARVEGVQEVTSGYAGGHVENPTYREVCGGRTGHAEVVQVQFDPEVIGFHEILEIFFAIHDPTTLDRQGGDVGPQYRSIIFYHDEEQRLEAESHLAGLEEDGPWDAPIVTRLEPLERFWPAEKEHHRYYEKHPEQGYCRMVISPKLAMARKAFAHRLRE